jgi:hypothetical protein
MAELPIYSWDHSDRLNPRTCWVLKGYIVLYETTSHYADNTVYSLKTLYQYGVLPGTCLAYPNSQWNGWCFIKDCKGIARCYIAPHSLTWYVSWLRHSPHVRSLPRAGITLFPILLGCFCVSCLPSYSSHLVCGFLEGRIASRPT